MNMSESDPSELAVNGLVDSRRAAALLGVSVNTFKVWASRAKRARSGIAAAMPLPVATMHGSVYLVEDIEEFGRQIALSARSPRSVERATGRYFTPNLAADFMAKWAVRSADDVVLEPSVGDGQFALAIQRYAASLGWPDIALHACELDSQTAAQSVKSGAVNPSLLHVGDFLAKRDIPQVDAVIGNPPYVRVRELEPRLRNSALRASYEAMGTEMDNAGSAWMPFVAKATDILRPGGRLAFVLPLDFTYVRYARPLWAYLANSFGHLTVMRFRERVFPDILQNVLILLADERGSATKTIEFIARDTLENLLSGESTMGVQVPVSEIVAGKRTFQLALLPTATREALDALESHASPAVARVKFGVGYVSGNKAFFHPSPETQKQFRLPALSLTPTVESSRQLSGAGLGTSSISPTARLWLPGDSLTASERRYVNHGEELGVDMAYKCRIRQPWYRVPGARRPDVILTAFSDRPRLHLNDAEWVVSNSVLGGYVARGESARGVLSSWYSPLTLLSTELQIHSLGGGVMIAVPREADAVQILNADSTASFDLDSLDAALRANDTQAAYSVGETSIARLIGRGGLESLYEGTDVLMRWRKAQS